MHSLIDSNAYIRFQCLTNAKELKKMKKRAIAGREDKKRREEADNT
jgi:hypothetical protein